MKTTTKKILLPFALFCVTMIWSQNTATYDISVTTIWNSTDHTSVPGSAHWSPLVGATHNSANEFVSLGSLATTGIQNVAEFGTTGQLLSEINSAITAGDADQSLLDGFSPFAGNNSNAALTDVVVSEDFSLITLVSMVAPSPDWFIAINSLDMRTGNPLVNNGWRETFTMDVFAYDAGTDDGTDYSSGDSPNTPVAVSMITGAPINGNRMATITFTFKSATLGLDDPASLDNARVYPNPVNDVLTITNTSNTIESAELYDVLGKRVKLLASGSDTNDIAMNVKDLQSGIYILRLRNYQGDSATRKVIID